MKNIQSQLRTLEGSFQSSFGKIEGLAKNVGSQLLGAFGVGLGVGALVGFAKHVIDVGDQLSDLSDQTGNTIEVLGGIKPILETNNTSLDSFFKGMGKVQRSLGDIDGAGKEAGEAFKALGLNVRELQNLTPDQFLEKFVEALAKVENRNERAAIAFRVLGKAAQEQIPAILELAENGIPKLDKATADAYRTLGQFKDWLVIAGAAVVNFSALLIEPYIRLIQFTTALAGLRNLTTEETFGKLAVDIDRFTGAVSRSTGLAVGKIEGMSNAALAEMAKTSSAATQAAITSLVNAREAFNKVKPPSQPGEGKFKDLLPGASTKDTGVQQFLAGLGKEVDSLIQKFELLRNGEVAAFEVGLRRDVARFNLGRQLEGKSQVSPAEAEKIIQSLKARWRVKLPEKGRLR